MPRSIILHPSDNVATLIDPASEGETCTLQGEVSGQVIARQDVAFGHKICISPIPRAPTCSSTAKSSVAPAGHRPRRARPRTQLDSARARGDLEER